MYQIPPIENESDFENLVCDLFNAIENTNSFQRFGVKGQSQKGIDIFPIRGDRTIIQCKKKDITQKDDEKIRKAIIKDFDDSLQSIKNIKFQFNRFILASTFKSDRVLQEYAAEKTDEFEFTIEYWGWEVISKYLKENQNILEKYYPDFSTKPALPKNSLIEYKSKESYKILVLSFNTYGESKLGEFEKALFNYYHSLSKEENLEVRIKNMNGYSVSTEEAKKIRIEEKVDLVIWGSYESNSTEKEVVLRYSVKVLKNEIEETSRFNFRNLLDIESGYLPSSLHYNIHFALGLKAYNKLNYQLAISEFFTLINDFEIINFPILVYAADTFVKLEEYNSAKLCYQAALKYEANLEFVYYQLGTILFELQEYEEALEVYQKGLKLNSRQEDSLYFLGKIHEELGDEELAKDYYTDSIQVNSKHTPSFYALSHLLYNQGSYWEARHYALIIIKIFPDDYDFLNLLGNIYAKEEKIELAKEQFLKSIELKPNFAEAFNNLALTLQNNQDYEEAEIYYKKAIDINSENPIFYCNYGQLFFDQHKHKEATTYLEYAIRLKHDYYRAYNLLGLIFQDSDLYKAMECFMFAFAYGSHLAQKNLDTLCTNHKIEKISNLLLGFLINQETEKELRHMVDVIITMQKLRNKK